MSGVTRHELTLLNLLRCRWHREGITANALFKTCQTDLNRIHVFRCLLLQNYNMYDLKPAEIGGEFYRAFSFCVPFIVL